MTVEHLILFGIVVAYLALMAGIAWGQWQTRDLTAPGAQPSSRLSDKKAAAGPTQQR
jgi:hypothetical protein